MGIRAEYIFAGMGNLHGKITGHGLALGKEPVEDQHSRLVVVMTIKHRLILRYYSHPQQCVLPSCFICYVCIFTVKLLHAM